MTHQRGHRDPQEGSRPNRPARNLRRIRVKYRGRTNRRGLKSLMVTVPQNREDEILKFVFPFTPISVTYSDLSPEYSEVERPGNQPFVELKSFRLMKVSFTFLLAVPFDGVEQSVDDDIVLLRRMANSRNPVAIINMDRALTRAMNVRRLENNRNLNRFFFRVADLSVEAIRRNERNKVTVAQVSITLQEVANPRVSTIAFPQITYPVSAAPAAITPPVSDPGADSGTDDDPGLPQGASSQYEESNGGFMDGGTYDSIRGLV